ncbi:glycosyltransferase [Listeria fleischmannii]|uniref:Glycosyltransferase family 4 protein n=1 Tax=Listeria fleischmannii TaxID=1069827 RepID=A0A841YFU5_9LIST|nr:glycosyltransferase [Listeria fleischmannii]MBC1399044.1 glycosyltransferase family 4 protein [Listeria fleischmannii]MBC1427297.1 glycosyltransferase family 4 protein [Listeria fleischmannii]
MSKLRILLYGDIDLNFMDGSAVWLTSMAPMLALSPNVQVDLLLKAKEQSTNLTEALKKVNNIRLIQPFDKFIHQLSQKSSRLSVTEAVQIMRQLHNENKYDLVIVRGFNLVREVMKHEVFRAITVPYLTDFKHDERSTKEERTDLKRVYDHFDHLFLQTKETKEAFQKLIQVDGAKIQLLYPMIPNFGDVPSFRNKHSRLIYSGKFHEDWHTEEIISVTEKLATRNSRIHTQIVGDKFQDRLRERENQLRIKKALNETPSIDWVGAVSREACQDLIAEADIGISWRSASLDNDESVELSSKLLEYGRLGKPALVRRTKMHEALLGEDYPLFVDTEADFIEKTERVLEDEKLYEVAAKKMYKASQSFTFKKAYERLSPFIWSFKKTPTKIVFAGHDLKFAKMLIDHFESSSAYEVKLDVFSSHEKHDQTYSEACLEWADVIFCEWGLGNLVWYAKHKKEHQTLIARLHFQEKDLKFLQKVDSAKVDQFIVITPYMLEEFHRIFQIPRYKMCYIDNLIDAGKLDLKKEEDYQFHLGICGILPLRKRVDLALDLLEKLWQKDKRYKLFIKSKRPEELPWLMAREKEREYYTEISERIERAPWHDNVIFDPHGNDIPEWLQKIGFLLSPSDFEGSHVSVSEAMASGAVPVIRNWKGADTVYPSRYIVFTLEEAEQLVLESEWDNVSLKSRKDYAYKKFDREKIEKQIETLVTDLIRKPI